MLAILQPSNRKHTSDVQFGCGWREAEFDLKSRHYIAARGTQPKAESDPEMASSH